MKKSSIVPYFMMTIAVLSCAFMVEKKPTRISHSENWLEDRGLKKVESIIYDSLNNVFYATNGDKYGLGTDGYISKISSKGELLDLKWIDNLNRPTGMAIFNNRLYVADVNSLRTIDIVNETLVEEFMEPIENSGLNDVAINSKGEIFVTASLASSVFKVNGGSLEFWLKDEEKLKWANGIFIEDNNLIVAGRNLNSINLKTKEIFQIHMKPEIIDFDGIASDGNNGYFLSTVGESSLWHIDENLKAMELKKDSFYFGDLDYISGHNKIYAPKGNIKKNSFYIGVYSLN